MMKYRKSKLSFLIYSLLIHIILLVCWVQFSHIDKVHTPFEDYTSVDIYTIPRPILVKAPEPIVKSPSPEHKSIPNDSVESLPTPPKPKVNLNSGLEIDTNHVSTTYSKHRHDNLNLSHNSDSTENDNTINLTLHEIAKNPDIRPSVEMVNHRSISHIPSVTKSNEVPQTYTSKITLQSENTLNGVSLTVGAPKIHYGSRRGDTLRATGMGNSWGGSSSSGSSKISSIYIDMMKDIAQELLYATTTKKVDVVFVLDETASMVDNIRGIRAYFDFIFDTFQKEGHDASYSLVTFTDKTNVYGMTEDFGKFKNWLFKVDVDHGGDISESGLDALMAAVKEIKFRRNAQRFFILASDAAFHDADYDGRSPYSLDEVIETLKTEHIRVDVIGLDYLPIKQIAMGTGGTWRAIPGKGYLEYIPHITLTAKMLSKLGTLTIDGGTLGDKITVFVNNPPRPKQLTLTWKVLNPLGERCYGPNTEIMTIPNDTSNSIELTPIMIGEAFQTIPGIYTVIYRLENDQGHKSILRRTLTYK